MSIIFIPLLLIIRPYISLYNRVIYIKKKIMSYILQITSIKEANLNFMTKAIINLATYLSSYLKGLLL